MNKEILGIKEYISSRESERSKDHLVFPLFAKLFSKEKFKKEGAASGADIYIKGRLVVELKTTYNEWVSGFFQAFHYQKKGLSFSHICVISYNFIGLWRVDESIPQRAIELKDSIDTKIAANEAGDRNSKKCTKADVNQLLNASIFSVNKNNLSLELFENEINVLLSEFTDYLENLDSVRQQVNPQNFIRKIDILKSYFATPMEAIHSFYLILPYWDTTSTVPEARPEKQNILEVIGQSGKKRSQEIEVDPKYQKHFIEFIESHYVFTNEEAGITVDYYFSRFDEALAEHNPEYVKQHGIFFTDINLSNFALWFIREKYGEKKLSDKYIVIDPAGGSGNLVSSWRRNHLKFKIVSELNPDLLKTIELRLKHDPVQLQQGYSIIPKSHENKGLNFIDKPAKDYYDYLVNSLRGEGKTIDKPFAFLLNPPYKNTDENQKERDKTDSNYGIDNTLISMAGQDAAKERYILFLAQILEMIRLQTANDPEIEPVIMIFTPTPWLIPRTTFSNFRDIFDQYFKFEKGFMITGREFFKGTGRWPVSFTIWRYSKRKNNNKVKLFDFTSFNKSDLSLVPWNQNLDKINQSIKRLIRGMKEITFDNSRADIRDRLPLFKVDNDFVKNKMYDFKRDRTKAELEQGIVGGLPIKDPKRQNKKTYGVTSSEFVGFMDDNTPVRVKQDKLNRMSSKPDKLWCKLETSLVNVNLPRIHSGPSDNRTYCAYDYSSAKILIEWYAITRAINGRYPVWANQFDLWPIDKSYDSHKHRKLFFDLCFAYTLFDNICVVTKYEKDNPIPGAPEVFVDNPLCPTNDESFWSTTLDSEISDPLAISLVDKIKELYSYWNVKYCKGQFLENVGLQDEPYFRYFDYPDFLTPYSGLIQIRKYAEINSRNDLIDKFDEIKTLTKEVKDKIFDLLVNEFKYFE